MTNQQGAPEALRPIQRYKIGYHTDEWGMRSSTPGGISDPSGQWVLYKDHIAALVEEQQPAPSAAAEVIDLIGKLVQAESNKTRTHQEYMGKAMPDDVYARFQRLRDETIPALRTQLLDALATSPQPSPTPQADPLQPVVSLQEQAGMYADDFAPQADSQPAPGVESNTAYALPDFDTVEQHIYGACRRYITQDMLEPIHNLIREAVDANRASHGQAPAGARYEKELEDALRERDEADDCIDTLLDEVLGANRAEWSSAYGRADALEDVRERITALHKPAVERAWKQFEAATKQPGDVVAYLDVGAGGYLDLDAALSDEAMQQLPKGRHALVIAGTYGIDGYVAAPQPSPKAQAADSVPAVEREQERTAFKDAHQHLELYEVPDAWGRPMFKHSHVEASWLGWIARASHGQAPAGATKPTEQQILEAAEKAGLWPNTVHSWIPAFHRYHKELAKAQPAPQQEAQEPYAYAVYFPDQPKVELVHELDDLIDDLTNRPHVVTKLYTAPQPSPAAQGDAIEHELAMLIRRIVSSARRNCQDGSNVLKLANEAWAYLVRKGLVGSPLRDAGIESDPTPPAQAADSVLEDAADPLQGAANWLAEAHGQFSPVVLSGCLMIGYNRAKRLHDAALAARKQGEKQ